MNSGLHKWTSAGYYLASCSLMGPRRWLNILVSYPYGAIVTVLLSENLVLQSCSSSYFQYWDCTMITKMTSNASPDKIRPTGNLKAPGPESATTSLSLRVQNLPFVVLLGPPPLQKVHNLINSSSLLRTISVKVYELVVPKFFFLNISGSILETSGMSRIITQWSKDLINASLKRNCLWEG